MGMARVKTGWTPSLRAFLRPLALLSVVFAPTLAEEVKVLVDISVPYATDVRWFPDGRHLLLASCSGEFPEDVPYPNCRFVVFDTKTQKATPVKLANERGDWQAPGLIHVALADGPNCVWAVSTSGKLYSRALPDGMWAFGGRMGFRGGRLLIYSPGNLGRAFLAEYNIGSDRYVSAGEYDLTSDPLDLYLVPKLGITTTRGRGYPPYLIPYSLRAARSNHYAFKRLAHYIPVANEYEAGHYDGPSYDEAALIELPSKRVLYRVAGDRVLVSYDWSPAPGSLKVALIIAPKDVKKARDPRYRWLLVLTTASQTPSQTKKGNKISFDQSDRTPKSCAYPNDQARPGTEPPDSDWRTGPIDFGPAPGFDLNTCPEEER